MREGNVKMKSINNLFASLALVGIVGCVFPQIAQADKVLIGQRIGGQMPAIVEKKYGHEDVSCFFYKENEINTVECYNFMVKGDGIYFSEMIARFQDKNNTGMMNNEKDWTFYGEPNPQIPQIIPEDHQYDKPKSKERQI